MDDLTTWLGLAAAGLVAGVINTLAGGGSLITVPLLVFMGLPATTANGTNRIGVLFQNAVSTWRFRREGMDGLREAVPVLIPVLMGSAIGAAVASRMPAELFKQVFGMAMILLLIPMFRKKADKSENEETPPRSRIANALIFFGIGVYGGAIQAGVGLFLIAALARSGLDLVRANSIKVIIIGALTLVAVPVFPRPRPSRLALCVRLGRRIWTRRGNRCTRGHSRRRTTDSSSLGGRRPRDVRTHARTLLTSRANPPVPCNSGYTVSKLDCAMKSDSCGPLAPGSYVY